MHRANGTKATTNIATGETRADLNHVTAELSGGEVRKAYIYQRGDKCLNILYQ